MITPDYDIALGDLDSFSAKRFKREQPFVDRNEQINAKLPITISGGLQWLQQYSVLFDGVNDRVNCGNHATLWSQALSKFSLSFWMYPELLDDGTNFRDVMNHGFAAQCFRYQFRPNNPNTKFGIFDAASAEHSASYHIPTGTNRWYHVVFTYDNSLGTNNIKYFLDNVQVAQANMTEAINASNDMKLGETSTDFKGNIKDFRWWTTKALTQTEVNDIYNNSSSAPTPDYWLRMGEGTGNPVDAIGGKTTTLENGASWAAKSPVVWRGLERVYKYNILARVSLTRVYLWNVVSGALTRITLTRIYKYNVQQRISLSRIYKYNVLSRISLTRIYKYHVAVRVSL